MSDYQAAYKAGLIAGLGINKFRGMPEANTEPHISWTNLVPGWIDPGGSDAAAWMLGYEAGKIVGN